MSEPERKEDKPFEEIYHLFDPQRLRVPIIETTKIKPDDIILVSKAFDTLREPYSYYDEAEFPRTGRDYIIREPLPCPFDPNTGLHRGENVRAKETYFSMFPDDQRLARGEIYRITAIYWHDPVNYRHGACADLEGSKQTIKQIGTDWLERIVEKKE